MELSLRTVIVCVPIQSRFSKLKNNDTHYYISEEAVKKSQGDTEEDIIGDDERNEDLNEDKTDLESEQLAAVQQEINRLYEGVLNSPERCFHQVQYHESEDFFENTYILTFHMIIIIKIIILTYG